jgi:hypothetical protein
MNWHKFVAALKQDPKAYMKAIIENLDPPKYVIAELKQFERICDFCWNPRMDICVLCQKSVCEEHSLMIIGEKTKLEWYFCPTCQANHTKEELMQKVKAEDEQFWLEDHPEEAKSC